MVTLICSLLSTPTSFSFSLAGRSSFSPFLPLTLPCTRASPSPSRSQRVIDRIPFLNPTYQMSHWRSYRNPWGLKLLWGSSLSILLLSISLTQNKRVMSREAGGFMVWADHSHAVRSVDKENLHEQQRVLWPPCRIIELKDNSEKDMFLLLLLLCMV